MPKLHLAGLKKNALSHLAFALLGAVLFSTSTSHAVGTGQGCEAQFLDYKDQSLLLPKLPRPGSRTYRDLSNQIASQLKRTGSYAVLDLSQIFTPVLGQHWMQAMPQNFASQIMRSEILYFENGQFKREAAFESQINAIHVIESWMQKLIQSTLDREFRQVIHPPGWMNLKPGVAGLRASRDQEKGVSFGDWHLDGGGFSVTLSLKGPGTEVLGDVPMEYLGRKRVEMGPGKHWESVCKATRGGNCQAILVPEGHALILLGTAADGRALRLRPTVHRTPGYTGERLLLVYRF